MNRFLALLLFFAAPSATMAQTSPPSSPFDGEWTGKSDGGSCNTPLEIALSIESGIVDGTASDPSAHGPTPNLKKSAPPPPMAGLWQVYGTASARTFTLRALASVQGQQRRETKFAGSIQGGTMALAESGGCGRKASLTRK